METRLVIYLLIPLYPLYAVPADRILGANVFKMRHNIGGSYLVQLFNGCVVRNKLALFYNVSQWRGTVRNR